jgi:hypothetical protein
MAARLLAVAANVQAADLLLIGDPVAVAGGERIAGTRLPRLEIASSTRCASSPAASRTW